MLDFKGNIIFQPLGLGSRIQTLPDFSNWYNFGCLTSYQNWKSASYCENPDTEGRKGVSCRTPTVMWPFGLLLLYVYTVASQVQRVFWPRGWVFGARYSDFFFLWHCYPIQIFLVTAKLLWGSEACLGKDKYTDGEINPKTSLEAFNEGLKLILRMGIARMFDNTCQYKR